jgi:dihydrofolate synthase/folylpolyglutamate synthase
MPVEELTALAADVFGPDRVTTVEPLADAIDRAVALAEEGVADPTLGGTGVLITGSVVTAGEAGTLLRRS